MIDLNTLTSRIKRNCNISDAKFWGAYSLCGLLLRLRELYRFEKGVKPWERIRQEEIGEWISEREKLWKTLEDKDLIDIIVGENIYNPFEVGKINSILEKEGLIYGAGYGIHMKPSFFLGDLISKKTVDGHDIFIVDNEYVRDLSDYPAMLQDRVIFARVDAARILLWGRFEELRLKGIKGALLFAFSKYDISPDENPSEEIGRKISRAAYSEVETYVHHELGEAFEGKRLGDDWKDMLRNISHCKVEIFARGIKDLLSDTSEKGMIRYIVENQKEGSLGFYIVLLAGYRRLLFPEMLRAFQRFTETGDWRLIDDARKTGYRKAEGYAEKILSTYRENKTSFSEYIEKEILSRLH
ncbi:MAG: Sfum_1244 family protein [Nitrospirota bacterium]